MSVSRITASAFTLPEELKALEFSFLTMSWSLFRSTMRKETGLSGKEPSSSGCTSMVLVNWCYIYARVVVNQ